MQHEIISASPVLSSADNIKAYWSLGSTSEIKLKGKVAPKDLMPGGDHFKTISKAANDFLPKKDSIFYDYFEGMAKPLQYTVYLQTAEGMKQIDDKMTTWPKLPGKEKRVDLYISLKDGSHWRSSELPGEHHNLSASYLVLNSVSRGLVQRKVPHTKSNKAAAGRGITPKSKPRCHKCVFGLQANVMALTYSPDHRGEFIRYEMSAALRYPGLVLKVNDISKMDKENVDYNDKKVIAVKSTKELSVEDLAGVELFTMHYTSKLVQQCRWEAATARRAHIVSARVVVGSPWFYTPIA
eukprot:GHVU01002202.1.p1 GENE.GHVU01002202.1~~GHVU01002202.1.p1  ORF type:complete len:296 (+),score=31.79 GHVU01002202.1:407-1294(+)